MRKPFIAGNWKMNKTVAEGVELASGLKEALSRRRQPSNWPFAPRRRFWAPSARRWRVRTSVSARRICTGKTAALLPAKFRRAMVKELAQYVIIGHSERRQYFGETDETVNKKIKAALAHGITPIVCIGESLEQNKAGETVSFVGNQIRGAFAGIPAAEAATVILAYEPIWAIGTG